MGKKRKRPVKDRARNLPSQTCATSPSSGFRTNASNAISPDNTTEHSHPVISIYYGKTVTLRQYLLQQIPVSSKSRRRRIISVGSGHSPSPGSQRQDELATLLDTTLVGVLKGSPPTSSQDLRRDLAEYTQSHARSQLTSTDTGPPCAQAEIVEFVISTLFNRSYRRPHHLLAHGFQRARGPHVPMPKNNVLACSIPGIVAQYPNKNVQVLKQAPWVEVLGLLGNNGEEIMFRLLLDCGIFTAIDHQKGVYYQISGLPLSTLEPVQEPRQEDLQTQKPAAPLPTNDTGPAVGDRKPGRQNSTGVCKATLHKANSIVVFRRRMLYARPALGPKGEFQFGLTNRHVLNRCQSSDSSQTAHVMKYMFPRQFGLHNVFTSVPDNRVTTLPFQDYSSREDEIANCGKLQGSTKIPKRLRGKAVELVRTLQNRNRRCSYVELLRYYCPSEDTGPSILAPTNTQNGISSREQISSASEAFTTQLRASSDTFPRSLLALEEQQQSNSPNRQDLDGKRISGPKLSLTDYATPTPSVSAFCRAVLNKVIPSQFYGTGQHRNNNQDIVLKHVDRFVRMRRFESLSIHEVCKGIKVTSIPWLGPLFTQNQELSQNKLALSDLQKRTELLHEFIYYIFDSILIPLIRSHFYVTESQSHRNRLFYFRHDVWRRLTEQPLADLESSMFEKLRPGKAERMLSRRSLGYGTLRLLPKATGIRPILNLRRRSLIKSKWAGKTGIYLGPSINSSVGPIFNMLEYEKSRNPVQLGSSLYNIGEIHSRLKSFKERLLPGPQDPRHSSQRPFYFVKLDIQSCFDTIPQQKLIRLIEQLVSEEAYHVSKYVEMRPPNEFNSMWPSYESQSGKGLRKFVGRAAPAAKPQHLTETIASGGTSRRRNTVFVDTLAQQEHSTEDLLDLLDEHLRNNLVKFGGKYFRQRNGISQGSVLSSLLCNIFYAEMEREVLGFLKSDEHLLLRLVDDFLLITPNYSLAMQFLTSMIKGQPEYGITVNPAKSLVNFAAVVDGTHIPRLIDTSLFPYCGSLIHTHTLEVHKDQDRILDGADSAAATLTNSLTVDSTRAPGRSLHRKVLASFKLLMHPMYLDTNHNSLTVALSNLYANFVTSAMKMYRYMKSLQGRAHPTAEVVIRVIKDLTQLAHRLIQTRREPGQRADAAGGPSLPSICTVHQLQIQYLAAAAFRFVLGRKQTRYTLVIRWLNVVLKGARPKSDGKEARLAQVVRKGNLLYGGWRF